MDSKKEMTRKEFLVLTFTLIGSSAAIGNCDDDDDNNNTTGLGGRGGTTGGGGSGARGGAGGSAGSGGTGTGGGGGTTSTACTDPLPEMQAPSDHTHTLTIPASTVDATSGQTFTTGSADGHTHMVSLTPAELATLKGGGTVMVTSSQSVGHTHGFTISCT